MSDLESVLTRIEALLRAGREVDRAAGTSAVQAYIELVEPAATCMARCAAWAQRGLYFEAVSVADDYPRLSAVGRRLMQDDVAARVVRHLQPLAPPGRSIPVIDPDWLGALERAEAEVERAASLVERHQTLSLSRAPIAERIKCIRSLVRADPGSAVWTGELRRIEDAAQADLRSALRTAFENGDAEGVRRLAGELLHDQWTRAVPEELRREVRVALDTMQSRHARARYVELEGRIRDAHDRADEAALAELELAWVRVSQETGVEPGADADAAVSGSFEWLESKRQSAAQDQEFNQQVAQLDHLVATRADEASVSGQLAAVKRLDRELPPGLEQRVQFHLRSIQAARTRRLVGRIAAVVAVVVAVAALVLWRIQRADAEGAARRIELQVKDLLDRAELEEARELISKNPDLAQEAPLLAAASSLREREPAWKQDRENVAALVADLKAAVTGEIAPDRRADLEARLKALDPRLRLKERQELVELQRLASEQAARYMTSLREKYGAAADAWRRQTAEVPSLDTMPASDRYAKEPLQRVASRANELAEAGSRICQEHGQLPAESLASTRAEIDRLRQVAEAVVQRQKAIKDFEDRYAEVVDTAGSPDRLVSALDKLLGDCAGVVDGRGLSNQLRDAREIDVDTIRLVAAWRELLKGLSAGGLLEGRKVPPVEQLESLRKFVDERPESDLNKMAARLLSVAELMERGGSATLGERLKQHLDEQQMHDLKVIPLQGGGRFYRRLQEKDGYLGAGVIQSRDDVARSGLEGIGQPVSRLPGVTPVQAPTARRVQTLANALESTSPPMGLADARKAVLVAIADIAATPATSRPGDEGAAFRLWVVMKLVELWHEQLRPSEPLPTDTTLENIAAGVRTKHSQAVEFDWGRPVVTPDQVRQALDMDAKAAVALKAFADIGKLAKDDRENLNSLSRDLKPLVPAGMVVFDPFEQKARAYGVPSTGELIVFERQRDRMPMKFLHNQAELLNWVQKQPVGPVVVLKWEATR